MLAVARWDEVITFILSLRQFLCGASLPAWLAVAGWDHFSSLSDRRRDWG